MSGEAPKLLWEGKYFRVLEEGRWQYASRCRGMTAVVIFAEVDGKLLLIEQHRVPIGKRCIELPAGLVGDEDENDGVLETAAKELREETGYEADHIEVLGEFYSSPGMIAESFTLVRATGLKKTCDGGGNEHEDILVHEVPKAEVRQFIVHKRAEGVGIDARILSLADFIGR